MKKFSKIAVILLTLTMIGAIAAFAACTKKGGLTIAQENMPQVVFVEGNDIDLSKGRATLDNGETIPLNAEGVTITGYDKSTLGEQQITIGYGKLSTTLTVTVVPRLTVEGITDKYFVGEKFDASKGKLVINNDDGTSSKVDITDKAVTLGAFNPTEANAAYQIDVRYVTDQVAYTGKFPVAVYAIDTVKSTLTAPTKKAYQSHETELSTTGGYFKLVSTDGAFEKNVALTKEMVTGFNPADVTAAAEQRKQKLSATYGTKTATFEVTVTYSKISAIKDTAKALTTSTITDELRKKAYDSIQEYLALPMSERDFISADEQAILVKEAAAYGLAQWNQKVATYTTFTPTSSGSVSYTTCKADASDDERSAAVAKAKTDSAALKADDDLKAIAKDLILLRSIYGLVQVDSQNTVEDYLGSVCTTEQLDATAAEIDYMTGLYEKLSSVEGDWLEGKGEDIKVAEKYNQAVTQALTYIQDSAYNSEAYRQCYSAVVSWYPDFFDILYTYAYSKKAEEEGKLIKSLYPIYLPADLEELYEDILITQYVCGNTADMMQLVSQAIQAYGPQIISQLIQLIGSPILDNADFMLYYDKVITKAEEVNAAAGMNKWLYENFEITTDSGAIKIEQLIESLNYAAYGYYDIVGYMRDTNDEGFEQVWNDYLNLYKDCFGDEEYLKSKEFYDATAQFLYGFLTTLTPGEQSAFLKGISTPYFLYGASEVLPVLALDLAKSPVTFLGQALLISYEKTLLKYDNKGNVTAGQSAMLLLANLLYAAENYANGDLAMFFYDMETVNELYNGMTEEEKEIFNSHKFGATGSEIYDLKEILARYNKIYNAYDENANFNYSYPADAGDKMPLDTTKEKFREMSKAFNAMFYASSTISNEDTAGLSAVLAAFEYADKLLAEIKAEDPNYMIAYAYDNNASIRLISNGAMVMQECTMEYAYNYYRNMYLSYIDSTVGWATYSKSTALKTFMADNVYPVTRLYIDALTGKVPTDTAGYYDCVPAAMEAFRALDSETQFLFKAIEGTFGFYGYGITVYLTDSCNLEKNVINVAKSMLLAEYAYVGAVYNNKAEDWKIFTDFWKDFTDTYFGTGENALTPDEKAAFNGVKALEDMFNFYKGKYDEKTATPAA